MPAVSPVTTDEIYEKYLKKAIEEVNDLGHEIAAAGKGERVPVLGSGHPRADVFLLKHRPQHAEIKEGVAPSPARLAKLLEEKIRAHVLNVEQGILGLGNAATG